MTTSSVVIVPGLYGAPISLIQAILDGVTARYPNATWANDDSDGWRITVDSDDLVDDGDLAEERA